MNKRQRIKEIKEEIGYYKPKKQIVNAMLQLGELGFEFSGHGCGSGGEDFNLIHCDNNLYVNFCDLGRIVVATVYVEDDCKEIFKGTIGKTLKFISKQIEN